MKANRIILTIKTDRGDEVRQYTAKNMHMTGTGLYFDNLQKNNRPEYVPISIIDRMDCFFINVDPITFEPVISSSNESA